MATQQSSGMQWRLTSDKGMDFEMAEVAALAGTT
eukprot:CAMPEP_0170293650 /NCGR_PEP_ID=MMETSP0116_2-20130129/46931_1 /TAXON_ID=400756 /ORGANISM="Durinskia baltica, Strain CSIRO CS-38" /LENGTH=33 /DNA_ID= /DNA_START= /DNA_END= /DNA_ORIENTATION=